MKLDATDLRYISTEEFRTLTAVEMGSKNHEIVPTSLIARLSALRGGGVNKHLSQLARRGLVGRVKNAKYEGYRLTYGGYDFLAIRTFAKRDTVYSVGNQIGTGKESDIHVVAAADGEQRVLKIQRLGRISFRAIKSKRDYLQNRQSASWMYMSRLAATKEYTFMKVLHEHGFPVPKPIDHSRHCVVMQLIDAFPLRQISDVADPGALYSELMDLIVKLARSGLIHGDFNEFNILVGEDGKGGHVKPVLIDFPQMVSTDHLNAEYYFNRDVECIRQFFKRRFRYESTLWPKFSSIIKDGERDFNLDVVMEASGWTKKDSQALEKYMEEVGGHKNDESGDEEEEDDDDEDEDEEDDEDEVEEEEAEEEETEEVDDKKENTKDDIDLIKKTESIDISASHQEKSTKEKFHQESDNSDNIDDNEEEKEEEEEEEEGDESRAQRRQKEISDRVAAEYKAMKRRKAPSKTVGRARRGNKAKSDPNRKIRDEL